MESYEELKAENIELRKVLELVANKSLLREILIALKRIKSGEYVTEEEFFKDSPLTAS